jgi:hypothetical protein
MAINYNPKIMTLLQFKDEIASYPGASGPAFIYFENEILHGGIKVPGEKISSGDIRKWCQELLPKVRQIKPAADPYFKEQYPEIKPLPVDNTDMCRQCARVVPAASLIGDLKLCADCCNR